MGRSPGSAMRSVVLRDLERALARGTGAGALRPQRRITVSTGVPELDALLPGGGLPRGQPIEWFGPRSCGKTALLRATFERLRGEGEPVAIIDTTRSLYAPDWTNLKGDAPFWVVRPPGRGEALWCADLLLRSGAFGAVALETWADSPASSGRVSEFADRGDPVPHGVAVRLQHLAEEAGAVLIVVGELPLAALRLRFRPAHLEPVLGVAFGPFLPPVRPVWVEVGKVGGGEIPILCPPLPERGCPRFIRDRKGPR